MSHVHKTYQPLWDMETGWSYMKVGGWEGDSAFHSTQLDGGRWLLCVPDGAEDALVIEDGHDVQDGTEEEIAACVECTPVAAE